MKSALPLATVVLAILAVWYLAAALMNAPLQRDLFSNAGRTDYSTQDLVGASLNMERPKLPAFYRGVHRLNRDEQGRVKCVACYMCSTACPAHCIDIVAAPSPWPDREKYPETFVIDELRCIYCGMCEQACPCDAIELTSLFDLTGLSREEMMFDKEKLLSVFDQTVAAGTDPIRTRSGPLGPASELPVAETS